MTTASPLDGLDGITPGLEDLYRALHADPEVSHRETRTAQLVADRLERDGYVVHRVGGGVVGVLANGDGPVVLARADIDALPVAEDTGLDYASTKTMEDADGTTVPVMHACGHDVHITAGLGAAHLLAQATDAWSGTYVALFQPAEETGWGARQMVDDGLADAIPTPDVALAQHVMGGEVAAGQVGVLSGAIMSTAASLRVTVHGNGTHGSMPHLGIDPVVIAASIVVRLQSLVSREISPAEFGVVTVGSLQAGSTANVVPDRATLLVNVRAYSDEVRDALVDGIRRIVAAECAAGRSPEDPEVEVYQSYPLTENDPDVTAKVAEAFRAELGEENVVAVHPATASEDFSVVPDALGAPYAYWFLGGFTAEQDVYPNHNPKFAPAVQPTLAIGVRALVTAAMAYLGKEA